MTTEPSCPQENMLGNNHYRACMHVMLLNSLVGNIHVIVHASHYISSPTHAPYAGNSIL